MNAPEDIFDVVVIGAGIIGITTAEALCGAGLRVCVLERRAQPACETSHANGGLITPSMAEPWAVPGLPRKVLGWIGKEDAPFLLRIGALPSLLRWGMAFVKNCTQAKWETNTQRMIALSLYSRLRLIAVLKAHNLDDLLDTQGSLRVFRNAASASSARPSIEFMLSNGIRCVQMNADDCVKLEPALAHMHGKIHTAYHYPDDVSGDCNAATKSLAVSLEDAGVQIIYESHVHSLTSSDNNTWKIQSSTGVTMTKNIVLATGMSPKHLLKKQEIRSLLCAPVKGYSVTMRLPSDKTSVRVPVIDDANKVGVVRLGDKIRAVGTAEFCGTNNEVSEARIQGLLCNAEKILPDVKEYTIEEKWAGLRPMSPDGLPYIGALARPGLYVNLGHGHLGWTNACGAAAILRDLIIKTSPTIDADVYAPRLH